MTATACPVCATPYETGATACAFCGVSLVDPLPEAKAKTKARTTPRPAAKPAIHADEPPPSPVEAAGPPAEEPPSPAPVTAEEPVATPAIESEPEPESAETVEAAGSSEISVDTARPPTARAPSFAKDRAIANTAHRRLHRIEWGVVAGLAVLLLVQVVASDFDQLAASGTTRPWLQTTCGVLHCALPSWREPQALHLLQRDVRANPQHPGLLRISASFRNEARWTQPWPLLRVTLSDADGRAIGARDFTAGEYLGATPTTNGIASGQVASVAFDVTDPSPRVTAFTFEFR